MTAPETQPKATQQSNVRVLPTPEEPRPTTAPDAEAALIGNVLMDPSLYALVASFLRPEHFASLPHLRIWEAVGDLLGEGAVAKDNAAEPSNVDLPIVAERLRATNRLREVSPFVGGGLEHAIAYLTKLVTETNIVAPEFFEQYAQMVFGCWQIRELHGRAKRIAGYCQGGVPNVREVLDRAEKSVIEITRSNPAKSSEVLLGSFLAETIAGFEPAKEVSSDRVPTGFILLDEVTTGMRAGEYWSIAGRSGRGKSALVSCIAMNVAAQGLGVAHFQLEMTKGQMATRIVCSEARVPIANCRKQSLSPAEWARVRETQSWLTTLPIWIDDTPGLGFEDVRRRAKRIQLECHHRKIPLGLVVVDTINLMKANEAEGVSRSEQLAQTSRWLKRLFKELQAPGIVLCQFNRGADKREGRPKREDVADSKSMENDSDVMLLVHHDKKAEVQDERAGVESWTQAEVIVAKNRNADEFTTYVAWKKNIARFDNRPQDEEKL